MKTTLTCLSKYMIVNPSDSVCISEPIRTKQKHPITQDQTKGKLVNKDRVYCACSFFFFKLFYFFLLLLLREIWDCLPLTDCAQI